MSSRRRLELLRIDRRCALGGIASSVLVACGGDSTTGTDAAAEAAPESGDETVDCSGTAGTLVGAETDFPIGTWTLVGGNTANPYIIGQDNNGFFAFTGICTHAGCTVGSPASDGTTICPCHGSEFNANGAVIFGPAFRPLQHYAVNICGGSVRRWRHPVNPATRTTPQ